MEYVRVIEQIDAPIGEVWAIVSGFGGIRVWITGVQACSMRGDGPGAVRTVATEGAITREKLIVCDGQSFHMVYALEDPTILPAKGISSEILLRALSDERTELTWISQARHFDVDPAELAALIEPFYRSSIVGLRKILGR